MGSAQSEASQEGYKTLSSLSQGYAQRGMSALDRQGDLFQSMLKMGGEPQYMKSAFETQRAGLQEGAANQGFARYAEQQMGAKHLTGNAQAQISPYDIGSQIANAMGGSRAQQGMAAVDETNNIISQMMGAAGQTGSQALNAAGANLNAVSMLPKYNEALMTAGTIGSALYSGYGGYQKWAAGQPQGGGLGTNFAQQMPQQAVQTWGMGASPGAGNQFGAGVQMYQPWMIGGAGGVR